MRLSAGAGSPLRAAALLLAVACFSASENITTTKLSPSSPKSSTPGPADESSPATSVQSISNTSVHNSNGSLTTTLGSTKTTITTTQIVTATNTTIQTTKPTTTSKPTTTTRSTINVTVTTSKTMSPSTSITATPKSAGVLARTSRFDVGSFVGGIVLTLGMLAILYVGCKTYHSRRGVQYRTIDEHDAII